MNVTNYFRDLSTELSAVQNRIRHFIGDAHWPSDGMWKESVLRTVIRGYLPTSLSVGSGFILTADGPSSQIDILIFDSSGPIFFKDGDFVIVPPDTVRVIIEVKTSLNRTTLRKALKKLDQISKLLRRRPVANPFLGLFSFEELNCPPNTILETLKEENPTPNTYPISAMCFGNAQFHRFWEFDPRNTSRQRYDGWHAYDLPNLGPGYFIHNIIEHLFPHTVERAESSWYPAQTKEMRLTGEIRRHEG